MRALGSRETSTAIRFWCKDGTRDFVIPRHIQSASARPTTTSLRSVMEGNSRATGVHFLALGNQIWHGQIAVICLIWNEWKPQQYSQSMVCTRTLARALLVTFSISRCCDSGTPATNGRKLYPPIGPSTSRGSAMNKP